MKNMILIGSLVAAFILIGVCLMRISQLKSSQDELQNTLQRL